MFMYHIFYNNNNVQNGFPLWFRVMHVLNAPRLAMTMYNIMKPFLGERIKVNRCFVMGKNNG